MEYTNRLKLPLLIPNQSSKEITHNEALVIIDNLLQNHIITRKLNTSPTDKNFGDIYIVASGGINDWKHKDNQLAIFDNGWRFVEPVNGMIFYILDENCFYVYDNEWKKLESVINFENLKNVNFNNLQKDDIVKYDGNNFINTKEINLLNLCINNKLLIDENLNFKLKNNEGQNDIISITDSSINFKNKLKISDVSIDDYIINTIITNENGLSKADLSNLTTEGQEIIKNIVASNVALNTLENIEVNTKGKEKVFECFVPDYNSMISRGYNIAGQNFTIEEDGFVRLSARSIGGYAWRELVIKVNNADVYFESVDSGNIYIQSTLVPVKKGDVVYLQGGNGDNFFIFYPLIRR